MEQCLRCWIRGRVQGVSFRANTRARAEALGLSGEAVNLADGRVRVTALGAGEALEALRAWLAEGPPQARVEHVECEHLEAVPEGIARGRFVTG